MTAPDPWPLFAAAATLGLAGSAHCLGMCGGIAAAAATRTGARGSAVQGVVFNLGRMTGYALLGTAVGALAGAAIAGLPGRPVAIGLRLLAALLMLALGLSLLAGRDLLGLEALGGRLWRRLGPVAGRSLALAGLPPFVVLGVLWGFLPCGLVYSALSLAAVAGSAAAGALSMLAFGAGTLPSMLAVTFAGAAVTRRLAGLRTRRAAGILMIVFAAWTALGPLALHAGPGSDVPAGQAATHH